MEIEHKILNMEIEHVCIEAKKPVKGTIIGNGTMAKTDFLPTGMGGMHSKQTQQWKTIIVKCDFCGDEHEYALCMDPQMRKS